MRPSMNMRACHSFVLRVTNAAYLWRNGVLVPAGSAAQQPERVRARHLGDLLRPKSSHTQTHNHPHTPRILAARTSRTLTHTRARTHTRVQKSHEGRYVIQTH